MRFLLNPGIYIGALVAFVLVLLSYQTRPSYDIPFGTATDGPLLSGFNAGETQGGEGTGGRTYRWSSGDAYITLQDVGRQDFEVVLSVDGSRPDGQPPPALTVTVGSELALSERRVYVAEQIAPAPHDYAFNVPREQVADGTLTLHLASNTFTPPGDPRELGVIVTGINVTPSANPDRFIEPPLSLLVYITLTALLLGLVLAALGWGVGGVVLGGVTLGLLAAWLLVADRLWLTTKQWYSLWLPVLLAGVAFVLLVGLIGGWLLRRGGTPWSGWERRAILTLMLVVFAVRLAGQLHPQILIVDLFFQLHRFETVQSGQLLFTTPSAEWGGRANIYLPTTYVFMLPFQWLLNDELLVIRLFTVGLSTLGAFVVFFIGKRALASGRAGLMAAVLYLAVPMAVLPFSWGITSNVFGDFFALLSLAIAVTGYEDLRPTRPVFWALLFSLLITLLSHPAVVQLTLAAFTFISLLWLVRGQGGQQGPAHTGDRRGALWLFGALALAFGLAYVLYYGHFAGYMLQTFRDIQAERAASAPGGFHKGIGGSVSDRSLGLILRVVDTPGEWFFGGLRGFWQEAQAYYRVWPVVGALIGYLLMLGGRRRTMDDGRRTMYDGRRTMDDDSTQNPKSEIRNPKSMRLALAAFGWLLAVALFAVVGWTVNLYVRYALFALPIVALGAGALLSLVWRKGTIGALLTTLVLVFFVAEALALWQYRITYAFK